jgi:hypothetical protein
MRLRNERAEVGIGPQYLNGMIRGAVVHSVYMELGIALSDGTVQRALQITLNVVTGENDRYFGPGWSALGHDRIRLVDISANEAEGPMLIENVPTKCHSRVIRMSLRCELFEPPDNL